MLNKLITDKKVNNSLDAMNDSFLFRKMLYLVLNDIFFWLMSTRMLFGNGLYVPRLKQWRRFYCLVIKILKFPAFDFPSGKIGKNHCYSSRTGEANRCYAQFLVYI
jgi:hypothetical protein